MTVQRRPRGGDNGTVDVTFDLPASISAQEVALLGDFNEWSPDATKLKRAKNGDWKVTIRLQAGNRYKYRYLLDRTVWENDWRAEGYVRNPFGADDSVVEIKFPSSRIVKHRRATAKA